MKRFLLKFQDGKALDKESALPVLKELDEKTEAWKPYGVQTLNKGTYSIVVESTLRRNVRDHDDFIIGNIKVKSDKKVVAARVYAK